LVPLFTAEPTADAAVLAALPATDAVVLAAVPATEAAVLTTVPAAESTVQAGRPSTVPASISQCRKVSRVTVMPERGLDIKSPVDQVQFRIKRRGADIRDPGSGFIQENEWPHTDER